MFRFDYFLGYTIFSIAQFDYKLFWTQ